MGNLTDIWIWIKPSFLYDAIPVKITSGCPIEAIHVYFFHMLLDCLPINNHTIEIPRSSLGFDAFIHTINHATQEILRRACSYFEILRGGSVISRSGKLKLIVGRMGSGKTSRISSLVEDGWSYAGDDFLFFDRNFDRVYFLPICLCRRRPRSITLKILPSRHAEAKLVEDVIVEVLRAHGSKCFRYPIIELFSLFLRNSGRALLFRQCCKKLARQVVWGPERSR